MTQSKKTVYRFTLWLLIGATLTLGVEALAAPNSTPPSDVTVTIYHTSDFHENTANMARIAGYVEQKKKRDPNTLFVDCGDILNKGELPIMFTRGEAMFALMSACRYDACIMGNHDSTYGTQRTTELINRFSFPLLAANCRWPEGMQPKNCAPYKIFELQGVKVAIIGTVAEHMNYPGPKPLQLGRVENAIKELVPRLRQEADIVVLLTHTGTSRDAQIAQNIAGIDVLCGGHSHALYREMHYDAASETIVQHSGAMGQTFGQIVLRWDGHRIVERKTHIIDVSEAMPEDATIKALRQKYLDLVQAEQPIAEVPKALSRQEATQWIAEAIAKTAEAEVVLLPKEFALNGFPAGKVTLRQLLEAISRKDVLLFSAEDNEDLQQKLALIRTKLPSIACWSSEAGLAKKPLRVAFPCAPFNRSLPLTNVGLGEMPSGSVQRIHRSLWQIAAERAKLQKTLLLIGNIKLLKEELHKKELPKTTTP